MLPDINLDKERFQEIVEDAKNRIHTLFPEWTDYNYHDPGITLIELFAWMKEIQQYKINQVNNLHKLGFLELLCIEREHRKPATTRIYVDVNKTEIIPKGSRFYAQDIVFETINKKTLFTNCINQCIVDCKDNYKIITIEKLKEEKRLNEYIFTEEPNEGNIFYIAFENPLPIHTIIYLGFNLLEDNLMLRKIIEDGIHFEPLAELKYEYYANGKWNDIVIIKDTTYGLLYDGNVQFVLVNRMEKAEIKSVSGYFIRVILIENDYEMPPVLTGIHLNVLDLKQQETLVEFNDIIIHDISGNKHKSSYISTIDFKSDEADMGYKDEIIIQKDTYLSIYGSELIFAKCNGEYYKMNYQKKIDYKTLCSIYTIKTLLPVEKIRIISFSSKAESFVLLGDTNGLPNQKYNLEDPYISYTDFEIMVSEENNDKECFYDWTKVETFFYSSPYDRHYILDETDSCIIFGDGINGKIPKGRIMILSYIRTLGSKGNVKSGTINRFEKKSNDMYIYHEDMGINGKDTEHIDNVFFRFLRTLKEKRTLVNSKDYENAVINMHGLLIENCKVLETEKNPNQITIIVKPQLIGKKRSFGKKFAGNILNYLEDKRMIGTKIQVIPPEYVGVIIYAQIKLSPYYRNEKDNIESVIREYFKNREKELGQILYYSEVYSIIDNIPSVLDISGLSLTTDDPQIEKSAYGDLLFPVNKIAELKEIRLYFS